jgi:hypothetical protein
MSQRPLVFSLTQKTFVCTHELEPMGLFVWNQSIFYLMIIPCCINVPIENQSVLLTVNRFSKISYSVSHGYGFRHSSGEHRAINNRIKLTVNTAANV